MTDTAFRDPIELQRPGLPRTRILNVVAYDELDESIRLINGAPVAGRERLTRRHRVLPVAVDVDQYLAVTVFLRRAHGGSQWQEHTLCRSPQGWQVLGGGGWGPDSLDVLMSVPTVDDLGGYAEAESGGLTSVERAERPASGARWVHYAIIRTTVDVTGVMVDSGRTISRPEHGRMAVVWRDRRRLPVTILGIDGHVLQELHLSA